MIAFNENNLLRSICKDSFYEFLKEFWPVIINEDFKDNWHIEYLCNELQHMAERVFANKPKEYDLIINISPGSTKSTICSIMFPCWVWLRKKEARFITASYTKDLALDLSRRARDIILSEEYQNIAEGVQLRADQRVKSFFMNTAGGFRVAVGTGGTVTGFHGHFLMVDDPINPKAAVSEVELDSANTWMTDTLATRKVEKAIVPTILIMQRLHQNDPTGFILDRTNGKGIKHICIPAEITDNVQPPELVKFYQDGLMDPIRLSRSVLEESRANGEYQYSGQFLQSPVPLGGGMFHPAELVYHKRIPKFTKFVKKVRYWDKAGTAGGGAYTAGVLMGLDTKGAFWILDVRRGQWASNEREKIIKSTAILDTGNVVVGVEQEPGSGGKESAEATARNLAGFRVVLDRPTGDKALRADPFSVQVNCGNVNILMGEWNHAFLDEMTYFPLSTYKDQIDAASGAFNRLATRKVVGGLPRSKRVRRLRRM